MKIPQSKQHRGLARQGGFTLIELVTVILLLGIIGAIGGETILQGFRSVKMATELAVLYEEGKLAMVRMEKEIHHAIPNAVQVQGVLGNTLSFGKIDTVAQQGIFGQYKDLTPATSTSVEDLNPTLIPANDSVLSIYNTTWADFNNGTTLYRVESIGANPMTVDSAIPPSGLSPSHRYYVCHDSVVRFTVAGGILSRLEAPLDTNGVAGAYANRQPLASQVSQTGAIPYFQYQAGTMARNAVTIINFTISSPDGSIAIPFTKEVQVRNVP